MARKRPVNMRYSCFRLQRLMDHRKDAVFTRGRAFTARSVRPGNDTVKLVLKHNRYFVESAFPVGVESTSHPLRISSVHWDILKKLLQDEQIQECRLVSTNNGADVPVTTNEV